MNSIYKNIQFTVETPEQFRDGKLPTLDFSMWIDDESDNEKIVSEANIKPRTFLRRK